MADIFLHVNHAWIIFVSDSSCNFVVHEDCSVLYSVLCCTGLSKSCTQSTWARTVTCRHVAAWTGTHITGRVNIFARYFRWRRRRGTACHAVTETVHTSVKTKTTKTCRKCRLLASSHCTSGQWWAASNRESVQHGWSWHDTAAATCCNSGQQDVTHGHGVCRVSTSDFPQRTDVKYGPTGSSFSLIFWCQRICQLETLWSQR